MPVYEYTALDARGKQVQGIVDADSPGAARQKIRSQGKYPVTIEETATRAHFSIRGLSLPFSGASWAGSTSWTSWIRVQDIHLITRQLATLLAAGIPLAPALGALIEQGEQRSLKTVLAQLRAAVHEGQSFSSALSAHPRLFSPIYINMVRAGEASGTLHLVLEQLAEFGERQQALQARIRGAMLYPVFMALVGVAVLAFLITFILPSITSVFAGSEKALPLPTTLLMGLSGLLRAYRLPLLLLIFALIAGLRHFLHTPQGEERWHKVQLSLPLFKGLIRKQAAARFARGLAGLLHSGVPLVDALAIVENLVGNVHIARLVADARVELEKGRSLAAHFRGNPYFPPMLVQMMAVGEQSGELDTMLARAADSYERELETKIMALTSMIEPLMILLMGAAVAFIVVAVLLPIFEMNQLIR
ncbi:MAG: type II secretion system inner membrane protein GspF [bacterium]|nr:type II secretion system inner membrane protein GspF [bacterium]